MNDISTNAFEFAVIKRHKEIIELQTKLLQEQSDLIALLKAQLQAKEEGDLCI